MRILLFFVFTLLVSQASAQRSGKGLLGVGFGLDLPKDYIVISGEISGAGRLKGSPVYLGAGVQVAKIESQQKVYVPLYLNFMVLPNNKTKAVPIVVLRPGFSIHGGNGNSGGLTAFLGAGVALKGETRTYLLAGYSRYERTGFYGATTLEGVGLRLGFLL